MVAGAVSVSAGRRRGRAALAPVFRLIPREGRFFDLFEEQGRNIVAGARRLREMAFDLSDAPAKALTIKEFEHGADVLTHELIRRIPTTFITPFDREDVYARASRLVGSLAPAGLLKTALFIVLSPLLGLLLASS